MLIFNMAAVPRLKLSWKISSFICYPSGKCSLKRIPHFSEVRWYRGSARDVRRRAKNKKMSELRKLPPKKYDYKLFISTNYEKELHAFAHRLNISPDNPHLKTALTHQSFTESEENNDLVNHNGKMAVLGFNITALFISEYLFFSNSSFPSYGLRSLQNFLVSREVLVKVARSLSIPELIKTPFDLDSPEEISEANLTKDDIISDSILALIASIYLDEGSIQAEVFVHDFILVELYGKELESIIRFENPEISLEALLLHQNKEKPVARITSRSAKYTHTPTYTVGVFSSQNLLGKGVSSTLEKAREQAYCAALARLLISGIPQRYGLPSHKETEMK